LSIKLLSIVIAIIAFPLIGISQTIEHRFEVGLELGAHTVNSQNSTGGGTIKFSSALGYTVEPAVRLKSHLPAHSELWFDVPILATPGNRVTNSQSNLPVDVATAYVLGNLKWKFASNSRVSPFISGGVGYARLTPGPRQVAPANNPELNRDAPANKGAYNFGGGVDADLSRITDETCFTYLAHYH